MPVAANIYYQLTKGGNGLHLPVVLIHGAGGSHLNWPTEIRRLPGLQVYSIDLPGHGKSEGPGLQDIHAYAEKIFAWMEAIKLHRAVFVGHSMGGAIALTLAKEFSTYVLGIVLISTGARLRVHPTILENTGNTQTYTTALSTILSISFSKLADPKILSLTKKRLREVRPSVLHGDLVACNNYDIIDALPAINSPTLVVCGQEDEMIPLRYSLYLYSNIIDANLDLIPSAGHMVMLEQPHLVVEAMRKFFLKISFQPGQK